MWAMGSAYPIGALPVLPGLTHLTILVDNDAHGIGSDYARICADRWRVHRRTVRLLTPRRTGADFNDLKGGNK
jgi:hypothetical protein